MSEAKTGRRTTDNPTVLRPAQEWRQHQGGVYRCMVWLIPEEEGDFSVVAANLPGVASQGDTEQEALANIAEALGAAIAVYKEEGRPIPWLEKPSDTEPGAKMRWVIVHV